MATETLVESTHMLRLCSQVVAVARRGVICQFARWRTVLAWLVLLSVAVTVVPSALRLGISTAAPMRGAPASPLPSCKDLSGARNCALIAYSVTGDELATDAHEAMKTLALEGNKKVLMDGRQWGSSATPDHDYVFVKDSALLDSFAAKNANAVVSTVLFTPSRTDPLTIEPVIAVNPAFGLDKTVIEYAIHRAWNKHSSKYRLPFRTYLGDVAWFASDFVEVFRVGWALSCLLFMAFLFVTLHHFDLQRGKERSVLKYLTASGLRHSAHLLGTLLSLLFTSSLLLLSMMATQGLFGADWTRSCSPSVWLAIWGSLIVSLFVVFRLLRSAFDLLSYLLIPCHALLSVPVGTAMLALDVVFSNDLVLAVQIAGSAGFGPRRLSPIVGGLVRAGLYVLRAACLPMRLPLILSGSVLLRSVDVNCALLGRLASRQVTFKHILNPEVIAKTAMAVLCYYYNLYIPLLSARPGTVVAKDLVDHIKQLARTNATSSVEISFEVFWWILSVGVCSGLVWYLEELSSKGRVPLFFLERTYWMVLPEEEPGDRGAGSGEAKATSRALRITFTLDGSKAHAYCLDASAVIENCDPRLVAVLLGKEVPEDVQIDVGETLCTSPSNLCSVVSFGPTPSQLDDRLTVAQFLGLLCGVKGVPFDGFWEHNAAHFDALGLSKDLNTLCCQLDDESRRLLGLFAALAGDCSVVVVRDPFDSHSDSGRLAVASFLSSVCSQRCVVVALSGTLEDDTLLPAVRRYRKEVSCEAV